MLLVVLDSGLTSKGESMWTSISRIAIGIVFLASSVASAAVVTGSLLTLEAVGYHYFHSVGGPASFNIRASLWTGGSTGAGLPDSVIYLARDNGSIVGALTGAVVASNDDNFAFGWDSDGSTNFADSFIPFVNLTAGDYVFGIGEFSFTEAEFRSGFNAIQQQQGKGDYQVTFSGVTLVTRATVPEPTTLALLGLGLAGLAWSRRRRV